MPQFSHLHCHTQYSVLDGAAKIDLMVQKAAEDGMPAAAITDHGNMFGVYEFVNTCNKNNIKPIVGCEFYMVEDMHVTSFAGTGRRDKRYHQLLLAKNKIGYRNLCVLTSLGYKEGLYGKFPRIDMNLLKKHKEGLIATTCCIGGVVPQTILKFGEEKAEQVFKEWLDIFEDDYYIELQRHDLKNINNTGYSQEDLNQILLKWGEKYNVKAIATNDSHYVEQEDSDFHDMLLCINTGSKKSTPIKSDDSDGLSSEWRFGFPNDQFFFKKTNEMELLFQDHVQCLENTQMIVDKVEDLNLMRDIMMPNFAIPQEFKTQSDYMRELVYQGARERYKELTSEVTERIEEELRTIFDSNFEGYFLVIEDFLNEAKKLDVLVGPGRGSAAGSVVSYCLGITDVDPLQYGLLFERFLNPERISFPDIDIDFEDAGRQKVLDYVVGKYGANSVAQIVTYGRMKEKMAVRDVARSLDISIPETNKLAKCIPDVPKLKLENIVQDNAYPDFKKSLKNTDKEKADELRRLYNSNEDYKKVYDYAMNLKDSVRNTGIHACGVIIAPEDLKNLIPLSKSKDTDMLVTQFDKDIVESVGLLKMDFLGLKTLSILKDIVTLIERKHNVKIDLRNLPLDDELTYKVFQNGQTDGIFQFESPGMKKHLTNLKPDRFNDLIAMNALYRPGPMQYIDNYIRRKHGDEDVMYDVEASQEILEETFGIMVYQEQVMLLSQKLANFSRGQADTLRKAMGKKQIEVMKKLFDKFLEGCLENGHSEEVAKKIWEDMEAFSQYAFNKSHSTCYSLIAYQCAYLKAHYPHEFLAGLMSHNMSNTDDIRKYIEVCMKMGVEVLGPDVNESDYNFTVNDKQQIRFGLSAIKGVGEKVIQEMVEIRYKKSKFSDVYDLVASLNTRVLNKKVLESLAKAGALDCFKEVKRHEYFSKLNDEDTTFIEKLLQYGSSMQKNSIESNNLFGESIKDTVVKPEVTLSKEVDELQSLEEEKEVLGMYLSGHPLNDHYKLISDVSNKNFTEAKVDGREQRVIGIIKNAKEGSFQKSPTSKGVPYMSFEFIGLEDSDNFRIKKDILKMYGKYIVDDKVIMISLKKETFVNREGESIDFTKILKIETIEQVYSRIKTTILNLDIELFDSYIVDKLFHHFSAHKGSTALVFNLLKQEIVKETNATSLSNMGEDGLKEGEEIIDENYESLELKSLSINYKPNKDNILELGNLIENDNFNLIL